MHFSKVGAVATLAGLGNAFLLPPTISAADSEIVNALPFEDGIVVEGVLWDMPCPGCPVAFVDSQGKAHSTNVENVLKLDLQIVKGETDRLLINGLPVYPIEPMAVLNMASLTAPQLIHAEDGTWQYAGEPELGYSLGVRKPAHSDKDNLDLITVHLDVLEVGRTFVQGLPSIEINMVETASGKLMLGEVKTMDNAMPSLEATPSGSDQECTTLVCKWRAIVAGKLSKFKGCGGKKGHSRPNANVDGPKDHDNNQGHQHAGHRRPHGHAHGHHHHRHTIMRFLRNITMHVLLPIAVGVAVGITASVVGMLVGNLAVFVWRMLFRRNQAQYTAINVNEIILVEEDDEKLKFHMVVEEPPTYTDSEEKV